MSGFVKLASSILDSSIWSEPPHVCKLWITMLAMCDRDGRVMAAVPGLMARARLSREECTAALAVLESPDPDDRSGIEEGRRIRKIQGGWVVINYKAYREMDYTTAERSKRYRDRQKDEPAVTRDGRDDSRVTRDEGDAYASASASESAFGFQEGVQGEEPPVRLAVWSVELERVLAPYARESRLPDAFWAAIAAEMNGMHGSATEAEVLAAVRDMQANGERFNVNRLRGYLRRGREHARRAAETVQGAIASIPAAQALSLIVDLVTTHKVPGRPDVERISAAELSALGPRYANAVRLVGGVARIIKDRVEGFGFLLRDFEKAWDVAGRYDAST